MRPSLFDRISLGYLRGLEVICFVLMTSLAIVVVLGVTYRKFGASLVWYDEVASILLAWITFYGAALAAYKGAHIAVTSLVDAMPRPLRIATVIFAEVCIIGFLRAARLGRPARARRAALRHAGEPARGVGRLYAVGDPDGIGSVHHCATAAVAARAREGSASGSCVNGDSRAVHRRAAAGVRQRADRDRARTLAAIIAMVIAQGPATLPNMAIVMYNGATNFPLIAIPLFILAGAIMNTSGISRRLIALASALLGFVRGGLAMVNVGTSLFFAEISGSAVADVAALGSVLMPAMKKKGYPGPFTAAITSSSASLAIIIPPSIPMILYAVMAGTSVVQLFVAGIVPGLIGGLSLMALCYWMAVRYNFPVEEVFQLKRVWQTFKDAALALLLPIIILAGIFGGLVTATEGAGLAVVAAIFIAFWYREMNWRLLWAAIVDGAVQTAVVMLLVASSALLGVYLTEAQVPQTLAQAITELTNERWAILALMNVFFLAVGLFLHSAAAIILVVPIVMPVVNAAGIDPVHFGLIVTLNLAIGQQTPPVASVLMTACSIAKENVWDVTRANIPFIVVLVAVLMLVTYVPVRPDVPGGVFLSIPKVHTYFCPHVWRGIAGKARRFPRCKDCKGVMA
jgi:C4-dicarboxylate transporter, DctM subunit